MVAPVEVWGSHACFTMPESKMERISYEIMTPAVARSVMESIYWNPGMQWIIDHIVVHNKPTYVQFCTNERDSQPSSRRALHGMREGHVRPYYSDTVLKSNTVLSNVRYTIFSHYIITDPAVADEDKVYAIFSNRLRKGQCYRTPYLGMRDFTAHFKRGSKYAQGYDSGLVDLGTMFYDYRYPRPDSSAGARPWFFHAVMNNGVVDLDNVRTFPLNWGHR